MFVSPFLRMMDTMKFYSKLEKVSFCKNNYIVKDNIKLKAFLNATLIKSNNISLLSALIKNLIFLEKYG